MSEWDPKHIDISHESLCSIIEDGLADRVKATHSVVNLFRYNDKWVIRLERDISKPTSAGDGNG